MTEQLHDQLAEEQAQKPRRQHKVRIVDSHMSADKEKSALEIAIDAVDKSDQLMTIAEAVKTAYDKRYPGSGKATEGVYHAICGSHFATCVSHETREYIHLQVDSLHIIIWKSKDTPFKPELNSQ